jgi:hypothetical protein
MNPGAEMATLMNTTKLTTVISLLVALSIASERLVDIIKRLNQQRRKPARRRMEESCASGDCGNCRDNHCLAGWPGSSGLSAHDFTGKLAPGLLASGGSGF